MPPHTTETDNETEKALKELRLFVSDNLDFLPMIAIERMNAGQQLALLKDYWDTPASFEHFTKLIEDHGSAAARANITTLVEEEMREEAPLYDEFFNYLLHKLPLELQEVWEDSIEKGKKTIDDLIKAVNHDERGLILGMHTSNKDFWQGEEQTSIEPSHSNDTYIMQGKERTSDDFSNSWYFTDPKQVFPATGSGADYYYIVEGSRADLDGDRHFDKGHGLIYTHRDLPARLRIPLNSEIMKQMNAEFMKMGEV